MPRHFIASSGALGALSSSEDEQVEAALRFMQAWKEFTIIAHALNAQPDSYGLFILKPVSE
jgi:hypothetical protein